MIFLVFGHEELDEYLNNIFIQLLNLSDEEFGIIKIAIIEVNDISEKKNLISKITDDYCQT